MAASRLFIFTVVLMVLSGISTENEIKKCSNYFDFLSDDLVLIKNYDFEEKINEKSANLDIIVEKRLDKSLKATLKLFDCKRNNPNDSTLCKYELSTKSITKILSAYNSGEHVCGQSRRKASGSRPRRSTEEITCGESTFVPEVTSLITGGSQFKAGTWPWMAALYNNLQYICGATIVSERVIVTAAHCIQDKSDNEPIQPEESNLVVGKHNLKSKNEKGFKIMSIEKFVMHPGWKPNRRNYDADIAVAVLQKPLTYKHNIKPICLGSQREGAAELFGKSGVVAGWGYTEEKNVNTGLPRIVEIPIIDDDKCIEESDLLSFIMTHRTFCTAGNLGKGPCKGDSGSGLAVKQNDKWILRGIVSATLSSSCDGESHVVFTDAGQFVQWIQVFITETTPRVEEPTTTTTTSTTTTPTPPAPASEEPEGDGQSWAVVRDQAKDIIASKAEAEAKRVEDRIKKIFG